MKIEVVKPNRTAMNFGFLNKKYKSSYVDYKDIAEIDLDEFRVYLYKNTKLSTAIMDEVRDILVQYLQLKLESK